MSLIKQANTWGTQGKLTKAMKMYRRVLSADPDNLDALQGLGIVLGQMGDFDEALTFFTRASAIQPDSFIVHYNKGKALDELKRYHEALASYDKAISLEPGLTQAYYNRGNVLLHLKRHADALASFDRAISLKPDYTVAWSNRGNVLQRLKRHADALVSFDRAISLNPDFAEAHINRGNVLRDLKRYTDALVSFDRAISLRPDFAEAHINRGCILQDLKRYAEALVSFDRAISLNPDFVEAHINRGSVLQDLNRHEDALLSFDQVLGLIPDNPEAWSNRGNVLRYLNRYEDALASCDRAISLKSDLAEAHINRGCILQDLKRYADAFMSFDRAISLKPDHAQANFNKGFLKLLLGDYEEGWPLYEWRRKIDHNKDLARNFKQPLWLGDESISGKTILVYAEQGLGDVIQFVRYVPMVEALGARVILEAPVPLASLLRTLKGGFTLIRKGDALPDFDLQCPIMSLPLAFGTTLDTVPAEIPYLAVNAQKQTAVRNRTGPKVKRRIGLVWSGFAGHRNDRNRSVPLRTLEPLLCLDFEYHSLQKEIRPDDEAALAEYPQIQSHNDEISDFAETAALITEMDLVITVDTSVAHLAGALGKVAWILLPHNPDWRWMTEGSESHWYPSVRLFREQQPGDWAGVISRIQSELTRFTTATKPAT